MSTITVSKNEDSRNNQREYDRKYKASHREILRIRQGKYQYKKRRITKIIKPMFDLEKFDGETFTQFYNRKIQELKDQDKYNESLKISGELLGISKEWLEEQILNAETPELKQAFQKCYNNTTDSFDESELQEEYNVI